MRQTTMAIQKLLAMTIEQVRAGQLQDFIPEFYQLKSVVENNPWHVNDSAFNHSLKVLERLKKNLEFDFVDSQLGKKQLDDILHQKLINNEKNLTKKQLLYLATLLHDIAKSKTLVMVDEASTKCPDHEKIGSEMVRAILARFDLEKIDVDFVAKIILNHGLPHIVLNRQKNEQELLNDFMTIKKQHADYFVELVLLALADTEGAQLEIKDKVEFDFRVNFYQMILQKPEFVN